MGIGRHIRIGFATGVAVIALANCTGDYEPDTAADGTLRGRCFPNSTCNTDLVCTQNVCLNRGEAEAGVSDGSSSSGDTRDGSGSVDGGAENDAGEDSGILNCTKKQNNEACESNTECCTNACREDKRCAATCEPLNKSCSFGSETDCCIGSWCGGADQACIPCIPKGQAAASDAFGIKLPQSCCSRALQNETCK